MAESDPDFMVPSSVVVIPDSTAPDPSSSIPYTGPAKRRPSSASASSNEGQTKRRRLSDDLVTNTSNFAQSPDPNASQAPLEVNLAAANANNDRRKGRGSLSTQGGIEEERRRGKRLFGSLIGTLSQRSSPSSNAMMLKQQQRRADIERKQQEKLKVQTEEYNEAQKKKLEHLAEQRKAQQFLWDQQSMQLQNSNLLAAAHFLVTEASPKLYYKPWELTPDQTAQIDRQVDNAKKKMANELEDNKVNTHQQDSNTFPEPAQKSLPIDVSESAKESDNMQANDNDNSAADDLENTVTNDQPPPAPTNNEQDNSHIETPENGAGREIGEDNEEIVVEAGEDAVICVGVVFGAVAGREVFPRICNDPQIVGAALHLKSSRRITLALEK